MEFWLEGFKRDAHPSREITWWEHVAACYLEYTSMTPLSSEQHKHAFDSIYGLCSGEDKAKLEEHLANLPDDGFEKMSNLVKYIYPVYDFKESFPEATTNVTEEWLEFLKGIDTEDFSSGPWFDSSDI